MSMRVRFIVALFAALAAVPAFAEPVFVTVSSQEQGHGWLFGAEWDGRVACWIATPRHVVRRPGGDELLPLNFVTGSGRAGDTDTPVWIGDVEGGIAAAGYDDLAFALVSSGGGDCRSRLGVPDYAYAGLMQSVGELSAWSMSPTSYGPFTLEIDRGTTTDSGGLLRLVANRPGDPERYMNGGISGAVAQAERAGTLVPVAMMLQVEPDTRIGLALRFDRIRAAFALVEAAVKQAYRDDRASDTGVPVTIEEVTGLPLGGSTGASGLLAGEGCFRAAPLGGHRTVDIVLSFADQGDATHGIAVASGECAAPGARYVVEQRAAGASAWSTVRDCTVSAVLPDAPDCRFDLRAPRQFRLRIAAAGPVGLAALRVY